MKTKKITNNQKDKEQLEKFISLCGTSLQTFRYFSKRPLSIIQNHLVTLLGYNENCEPIAYGHLDKDDDRVWLGICITENSRRNGYGNLMMTALIKEVNTFALKTVFLTVDKNNLSATSLYEKFGFKQVEISKNTILYKWGK